MKGLLFAILFLLFLAGGMCKTKAQWLNGVDFSKATNITVTLTKQSSNVFDISPSLISLNAEKAYSLTLISEVGTTDEYIFSAIEFFKGIALDSVVTENNIFRAPALLGFGTRKALSSSKKVTLNFVAVEYGQYTLFGGVPGYESQTRTLLKIIIFGSPNNTLEIPELNSYNTRLQNDARKNASHYIWKSVEKIDMVIQDNAPNYNTALLSPYVISLTKSQSAPSHTFVSDLFREAIWREVQDSNTKLRLYYLESVQLLQQSGSISNNSVELFLIPASNKTIGTRFQYNSYVGNVTNNGLIGYFILTAEVKVAISGLINPKFEYDLRYTRIWVVTSTCMTAVIVGVAFISVVRSHFF